MNYSKSLFIMIVFALSAVVLSIGQPAKAAPYGPATLTCSSGTGNIHINGVLSGSATIVMTRDARKLRQQPWQHWVKNIVANNIALYNGATVVETRQSGTDFGWQNTPPANGGTYGYWGEISFNRGGIVPVTVGFKLEKVLQCYTQAGAG